MQWFMYGRPKRDRAFLLEYIEDSVILYYLPYITAGIFAIKFHLNLKKNACKEYN